MWLKHSDAPHGTVWTAVICKAGAAFLPTFLTDLDLQQEHMYNVWFNTSSTTDLCSLDQNKLAAVEDEVRFPQGVSIITTLDISLSYTKHKDVTLAAVKLWIPVWLVGLK